MHAAFRRTDNVITVGEESSYVRWGIRDNIENVPDIFGSGQGSPLQREPKCWRWCGDRDMKCPYTLALCSVREVRRLSITKIKLTFALQMVNATFEPAQLRISAAKRFGSASSYTR